MERLENTSMIILKISSSMFCAIISAVTIMPTDSYEAVFSDIFFWISALLGTLVMLLVERADPKVKKKVTFQRVAFSIIACLCVIFLAGIFRASSLEETGFNRDFWFYAIVMFACATAPVFVELIILKSPKPLAEAVIKRATNVISGENSDTEHNNTNDNE